MSLFIKMSFARKKKNYKSRLSRCNVTSKLMSPALNEYDILENIYMNLLFKLIPRINWKLMSSINMCFDEKLLRYIIIQQRVERC